MRARLNWVNDSLGLINPSDVAPPSIAGPSCVAIKSFLFVLNLVPSMSTSLDLVAFSWRHVAFFDSFFRSFGSGFILTISPGLNLLVVWPPLVLFSLLQDPWRALEAWVSAILLRLGGESWFSVPLGTIIIPDNVGDVMTGKLHVLQAETWSLRAEIIPGQYSSFPLLAEGSTQCRRGLYGFFKHL